MTNDDEATRKARAESLRRRLRQVRSAEADTETEASKKNEPKAEAPKDESPREFIHRRMRELDLDKKKSKRRSR